MQHPLLELGKIHIEHHDDEQEQYRDCADIDDDEDHGEEFGAHHHEQTGRVDESENEKQDRMHGVACRDHHDRAGHADARKKIEKQRGSDHWRYLYGASSARFFAISRSQRSPFASRRSLS